MKKIINNRYRPILVDTDNEEIDTLANCYAGVDGVYVVPKDSTIVWKDVDGNKIVRDVVEGDIIVSFYNKDYGTEFVVVKSEEWLNAIVNRNDTEQQRKEEWAAKRAINECGDCDNC